MRIISVLLVIWLIIGVFAGFQRHYYDGEVSCAKAGTIAATVAAGPLNYVGANPKVHCAVPQPSSGGTRIRTARGAVTSGHGTARQLPAPGPASREVPAMSSKPNTRHPDIQTITDTSAGVYEAIATLEYSGTPATRRTITAATGLADDVIDQSLAAMLSEGLLRTALDQGEPVYVPTHRGWSTVPEQTEGKGLR